MGSIPGCGANCGGKKNFDFDDFEASMYARPGLTEREIFGIKAIFESLDPKEGLVKVQTIKELYKNSYDKPLIDAQFGSRMYVNFDEFYDVMAKNIVDKKKRFKDIEFDSNEQQASCLLCPYPVDRPRLDKPSPEVQESN
jgi:hypothetical protein